MFSHLPFLVYGSTSEGKELTGEWLLPAPVVPPARDEVRRPGDCDIVKSRLAISRFMLDEL